MTFIATKDPDATLDYEIDWEPLLSGDTIASVVWVIDAELTSVAETNTTTTAKIWLSGGTVGSRHSAVCRITTAGGRVDDRTLTLTITNR